MNHRYRESTISENEESLRFPVMHGATEQECLLDGPYHHSHLCYDAVIKITVADRVRSEAYSECRDLLL